VEGTKNVKYFCRADEATAMIQTYEKKKEMWA